MARTELQVTADAAALAAAWESLDEDRLKNAPSMLAEIAAARQAAVDFAALNKVLQGNPVVDPTTDVTIGYLYDPTDLNEPLSTSVDPSLFNSVNVIVRRDSIRNGPIALQFATVLGRVFSDVSAHATATFKDGVTGFKVTPNTGNAELFPLALKDSVWNDLMTQAVTVGDNYISDKATGQVIPGPDGILELNLHPGSGAGQLSPGNFGTVDIGSNNNSTADLSRQILYGVNESDMAFHGGELSIPATLNGDTGLSAALKDDLMAINGKARAIPLFSTVSGPGNNASYTITGFAGIRIMNVKLTGPMSKKEVIIQPAFVVDDSAMTGPGSRTSYSVYQPVGLSR